jgi:hypothetical protein
VVAIEKATADLKNEVDAYVKSVTSDMHHVQFRIALNPPLMPQMQAAIPDDASEVTAMSPQSLKIQIPAERVPGEYWKSIPPDLQKRLNEANGVEQIISEMWVYHAGQINAQNRQAASANSKRSQIQPFTPGTPHLPLTKPPVRIEIIPPRAGNL